MYNPISPKVIAASVGAGTGSVIATLVLWIIGVVFYDVPATAERVSDAMSVVPSPIAGIIALLLTIAGAGGAGYQIADPQREPSFNPQVVAYQTPSGLVVAGEGSPVPTGTPVDVTRNPAIPVDGEIVEDDFDEELGDDDEELGDDEQIEETPGVPVPQGAAPQPVG